VAIIAMRDHSSEPTIWESQWRSLDGDSGALSSSTEPYLNSVLTRRLILIRHM
jgi:hypothetical protein